MKPYELVDALIQRSGKSTLELAKLMHRASFQGTLYKVSKGLVTSPKRDTAELIARYFRIPVDALYDAKTATRIAEELQLTAPVADRIAEPPRPYLASTADSRLPEPLLKRIAMLDTVQLQRLEQVITAFLDAVLPSSTSAKRRAG